MVVRLCAQLDMLRELMTRIDAVAGQFGAEIGPDGHLFTLSTDPSGSQTNRRRRTRRTSGSPLPQDRSQPFRHRAFTSA